MSILPVELWSHVTSFLANRNDRSALARTCKAAQAAVKTCSIPSSEDRLWRRVQSLVYKAFADSGDPVDNQHRFRRTLCELNAFLMKHPPIEAHAAVKSDIARRINQYLKAPSIELKLQLQRAVSNRQPLEIFSFVSFPRPQAFIYATELLLPPRYALNTDHLDTTTLLTNAVNLAIPQKEEMIKKGQLDVEFGNTLGTLLHYAIKTGNLSLFDLLLDHGVNVNGTDIRGTAPIITLIFAPMQNFNIPENVLNEMFKKILVHGVDLNIETIGPDTNQLGPLEVMLKSYLELIPQVSPARGLVFARGNITRQFVQMLLVEIEARRTPQ